MKSETFHSGKKPFSGYQLMLKSQGKTVAHPPFFLDKAQTRIIQLLPAPGHYSSITIIFSSLRP